MTTVHITSVNKEAVYKVLASQPDHWMDMHSVARTLGMVKVKIVGARAMQLRQMLLRLHELGCVQKTLLDGNANPAYAVTADCKPLPECLAKQPRFDMRTLGTYKQGPGWMVASRAGAEDAQQIKSRTTFGGQAHV